MGNVSEYRACVTVKITSGALKVILVIYWRLYVKEALDEAAQTLFPWLC